MTVHELSATEIVKRVKAGVLSSRDLVDQLLDRIELLDGRLQAFAYVNGAQVRREADSRDNEAKQGWFRGPLHGVPFVVKDIIYTAGVLTEAGSALYRDFVPTYDATVVARLKSAGAILLGKVHTTELANSDPAPTRNPWNLGHTPGGSSSGSAAAVAAGMAPVSLGTQTGGSTLRPASFCGIAALKPSYGRVSLYGVMPLCWSLDHVGFMAREVSDLALLLQSSAGFDPADPTSSREPVSDYSISKNARPPRIGVPHDYFFEEAACDTIHITNDALERLARKGAYIQPIKLPKSFAAIHAAHYVVEQTEIADAQADSYATKADLYKRTMREAIEIGSLIPAEHYARAHRIRGRFRRDMIDVLHNFDVLAMPTTDRGAPPGLLNIGSWAFQSPWTAIGFPSLTIPIGFSTDRLPLGLQLVSAPFEEAQLLSAGSWCEAALKKLGMLPNLDLT